MNVSVLLSGIKGPVSGWSLAEIKVHFLGLFLDASVSSFDGQLAVVDVSSLPRAPLLLPGIPTVC